MPESDNLQMWWYQKYPAESPAICHIFEQPRNNHKVLLFFFHIIHVTFFSDWEGFLTEIIYHYCKHISGILSYEEAMYLFATHLLAALGYTVTKNI